MEIVEEREKESERGREKKNERERRERGRTIARFFIFLHGYKQHIDRRVIEKK